MLDTSKQFYFQWHFLTKCNLRCKHCYQEEYAHSELPLEKLKTIADQIFLALDKWGMKGRISLTGGEPFLSASLFPLLEYLDDHESIVSIDILTNGTLVDEEKVGRLRNIKKLHQIQISLDGSNAEIHDAVRGAGAFDKAIRAIRLLKETGFSVSVMHTLMQQNHADYMNVIDLAEREHVDAITVERVTPCGNSQGADVLPKDEIKKIYFDITRRANSIRDTLRIRRARPLWINTLPANTLEDVSAIGGFCPVGLTALAILWDGTVLPCRRLEIPIGNILTDGIFKIWYGSELLWKIRNKDNLKGKCHGCKSLARCGGCRAIAYAVTGDCMESDVQCWI